MSSRVCPKCETRWPISGYGTCPACKVATRWSRARPIPSQQASRLANALRFEAFYEEWDRNRDGPTPEQLGSKDAQEEIDNRKKGTDG